MIDVDRMGRWTSTARTWFRKATWHLVRQAEAARGVNQKWLVGYEAAELLSAVLDEAEVLVPLLNADAIDEVETSAKNLAKKLKARRLAGLLDVVDGRTVEEAAAFAAKAREMRSA